MVGGRIHWQSARSGLVRVVVVGWLSGLLPRFYHDELAHHPAILVLEDVAVEHVGQVGVGVLAEAHDQPNGLSRRDVDGVLEATQVRWSRSAGVVEDPEADVVRMEVVRAALGWYVDRGVAETSLRLVCFLTWFWAITDRIAEGRSWCERALALQGDTDAKSRAQALYAAGTLSWFAGDVARTGEFLDQSLRLLERLGDKLWLTIVHDARADTHAVAGELEAVRVAYEACLNDWSDLSRSGGVAATTFGLGRVHRDLGHRQRARSLLSTAAEAFRDQNDLAALAAALHSIADLELDDGQLAVAAQNYAESLSVARTGVVGHGRWSTTYCLAGLAAVAAAGGDARRAGLLWGVVERLEEERGSKLTHFWRVRYDKLIASVAGNGTFDEAVSAGRELSLEQAVDYGRSLK
jgi:tetratricopeptide (TPR) repeat protein